MLRDAVVLPGTEVGAGEMLVGGVRGAKRDLPLG
jgi:hypothetical protein